MCKISVIIPAYNAQEYIQNAIESAKNQTLKDIEIILVDDGSTDDTFEICKRYSISDKRIKVIHQDNKGISAARNIGIDNATGEYISFLDSDDTIELSMFEELYNCSIKYGEDKPDFIDCGINMLNLNLGTKNLIMHKHPKNIKFDRQYLINKVIPPMINISNNENEFIFPFVWNKIFKSSVISDNNLRFNEELKQWEDRPFLVQFLHKANSAVFYDKYFYNYITRNQLSLSTKYNDNEFETILYTFNLYRELFGNLYNFNNEYTIRYTIKTISSTINKIIHSNEEKNKNDKIIKILSNNDVLEWFNKMKNSDFFEKIIKYCIMKKYFYICIYMYRIKFSNIVLKFEKYKCKVIGLIRRFI